MSFMPCEVSCFPHPVVFGAFWAFQGLLLVLLLYGLRVMVAKPQEVRPKKHPDRDIKECARGCVLRESLQPLETECTPVHQGMDVVCEVVDQYNRTVEDLIRFLDTLNHMTSEDSNNTWTSIMDSEVGSSAEQSPSGNSCLISIMTDNAEPSSWVPLPALVEEEDMAQLSRVQPGLGHTTDDSEEQPGLECHPPWSEEADRCLEADSEQQHQQDLEIQLGAPSPPPADLEVVHSSEMETPLQQQKGRNTLEGLVPPESTLEQEVGLPASVDETPQKVPASASPAPQQPEKHNCTVVPMVRDLPFLDEAVKQQLEQHIVKMKLQRRYGLRMSVLEWEQRFDDLIQT